MTLTLKENNVKNKVPNFIPVQSSSIHSLAWGSEVLYARFWRKTSAGKATTNDYYSYEQVPGEIWELLKSIQEANSKLLAAQGSDISLGRTFHYLIKCHPEKYPYKKYLLPVS